MLDKKQLKAVSHQAPSGTTGLEASHATSTQNAQFQDPLKAEISILHLGSSIPHFSPFENLNSSVFKSRQAAFVGADRF
jgi:hypothetical protein